MQTDIEPEERTDAEPRRPATRRHNKFLRGVTEVSARLTLGRTLPIRGGGALAVADYRNFWLGSIVSNVGSWMQMVAQGWLILELTNSAFYLGLVGLTRAVPALSITLFGGVLADRLDRRRILLVTQVSFGVLALTLGLLDLTGLVRIWHVLLISFLSAVVAAVDNPSRQALVPDLVGKENLASAIGLNSAAWNGAAVLGPSLAGVLVATLSTSGAFILNGLSYIGVVWAVWKMQPRPYGGTTKQSIFENLRGGLDFMRGDRRVWGLMLIMAVPTFFARPFIQLMPIFADHVLEVGASGYGMLMAASGAGALAGSIAVAPLGTSSKKGLVQIGTAGVFGASLILFAGSQWYLPSLAILLVVGAMQTLMMGMTNTLLQLNVPADMRGRVMSAYTLIPMGLMPLGQMVLGTIGDVTNVPATVAVGAAVTVVFALAALRLFPEVRRMV